MFCKYVVFDISSCKGISLFSISIFILTFYFKNQVKVQL